MTSSQVVSKDSKNSTKKSNKSINFFEIYPMFKHLATSIVYVAHCICLPSQSITFHITEEGLIQFAAEKTEISTLKLNSLTS